MTKFRRVQGIAAIGGLCLGALALGSAVRAALPGLGTPVAVAEGETAAAPSPDSESYGDKWVPIVSILNGTRIGMARVNGPTWRLDEVQAVAQLELVWSSVATIKVYLPISTKVPESTLSVVKGCGVTGLGDLKL
jgi:hypothetical protein